MTDAFLKIDVSSVDQTLAAIKQYAQVFDQRTQYAQAFYEMISKYDERTARLEAAVKLLSEKTLEIEKQNHVIRDLTLSAEKFRDMLSKWEQRAEKLLNAHVQTCDTCRKRNELILAHFSKSTK